MLEEKIPAWCWSSRPVGFDNDILKSLAETEPRLTLDEIVEDFSLLIAKYFNRHIIFQPSLVTVGHPTPA